MRVIVNAYVFEDSRSVMCQAGENGRNNWKEVLFLIQVGK
jgi:hypothetical protein